MAQSRNAWTGVRQFFGLGSVASARPADPARPVPRQIIGAVEPVLHSSVSVAAIGGDVNLEPNEKAEMEIPFTAAHSAFHNLDELGARPLQSVVDEVRGLASAGNFEQAIALCEAYLKDYPDFRDEYGHPAYLKEMLRLNLALGQAEAAGKFSDELQAHLPPHDPCVQILYARHLAKAADPEGARAAWTAVLGRAPGYGEAVAWLGQNPV